MGKQTAMTTVKLPADIVQKAKIIAAARKVTLIDYLTELVQKPVDRDLAKVARGLAGKSGDTSES